MMRSVHMGNRSGASILASILAVVLAGCSDKPSAEYKSPSGHGPGAMDPDAPTEFTATPSGLKYRILRKSDKTRPKPRDRVAIHYRMWFEDGHEFENSYIGGKPVEKWMGELLPGWREGLQLIGEGGWIELEIPPDLAFGDAGQPEVGIPPKARMRAQVELREVAVFRTEPGPVDKDAPDEFTRSESGLQYRIRRRSSGEAPDSQSIVSLHVKCWLDDGTEFDNTYSKGLPVVRRLANCPPGFVEGVQQIAEGGMVELIVPPKLAFGEQRQGRIPPNSTLHYIVELVKFAHTQDSDSAATQ